MLDPSERTQKRQAQRKRHKARARAPKKAFDMAAVNELMKRLWLPALRESLNASTVLFDRLKG